MVVTFETYKRYGVIMGAISYDADRRKLLGSSKINCI
jgi:hypothetical protein